MTCWDHAAAMPGTPVVVMDRRRILRRCGHCWCSALLLAGMGSLAWGESLNGISTDGIPNAGSLSGLNPDQIGDDATADAQRLGQDPGGTVSSSTGYFDFLVRKRPYGNKQVADEVAQDHRAEHDRRRRMVWNPTPDDFTVFNPHFRLPDERGMFRTMSAEPRNDSLPDERGVGIRIGDPSVRFGQ